MRNMKKKPSIKEYKKIVAIGNRAEKMAKEFIAKNEPMKTTTIKAYDIRDPIGKYHLEVNMDAPHNVVLVDKDGNTWSDHARAMSYLMKELHSQYEQAYQDATKRFRLREKELLHSQAQEILDEAIAIFEKLPEDEPMTKNPVILS